MSDIDWTGYLDSFIGSVPEITEPIPLRATDSQEITPTSGWQGRSQRAVERRLSEGAGSLVAWAMKP